MASSEPSSLLRHPIVFLSRRIREGATLQC
ncbi:hypothetical protein J2T34_002232 [Kerstersia gyiorum]|nr:hypothetical protein [Kerstersia gyiorum]MCP1709609.1 hypothetical protein [Kerstersia gyiorum]